MVPEEAKWYVIHTYSGYEQMVKGSLEKLIENNNLQDKIFNVYIPLSETLEERQTEKRKSYKERTFLATFS